MVICCFVALYVAKLQFCHNTAWLGSGPTSDDCYERILRAREGDMEMLGRGARRRARTRASSLATQRRRRERTEAAQRRRERLATAQLAANRPTIVERVRRAQRPRLHATVAARWRRRRQRASRLNLQWSGPNMGLTQYSSTLRRFRDSSTDDTIILSTSDTQESDTSGKELFTV